MCYSRFHGRKSGFTLIELLIVISIIAILAVLALPAISSLFQAQTFSKNVSDVQYILEQARATAMAQNTFVWLGFNTATTNGVSQVAIAAVESTGGLSTDLANNNFRPAMKPMILRNVGIVNSANLTFTNYSAANSTDISQSGYTFTLPVAGNSTAFTSVIAFSPNGEASLASGQTFRSIGLGLKVIPGPAAAQTAAIQVSGLNGEPTTFRQ